MTVTALLSIIRGMRLSVKFVDRGKIPAGAVPDGVLCSFCAKNVT